MAGPNGQFLIGRDLILDIVGNCWHSQFTKTTEDPYPYLFYHAKASPGEVCFNHCEFKGPDEPLSHIRLNSE